MHILENIQKHRSHWQSSFEVVKNTFSKILVKYSQTMNLQVAMSNGWSIWSSSMYKDIFSTFTQWDPLGARWISFRSFYSSEINKCSYKLLYFVFKKYEQTNRFNLHFQLKWPCLLQKNINKIKHKQTIIKQHNLNQLFFKTHSRHFGKWHLLRSIRVDLILLVKYRHWFCIGINWLVLI